MPKRGAIQLLTLACAAWVAASGDWPVLAADANSSMDSMWNEQGDKQAPAGKATPPDTTPDLPPETQKPAASDTNVAPEVPASSAPAAQVSTPSSAPPAQESVPSSAPLPAAGSDSSMPSSIDTTTVAPAQTTPDLTRFSPDSSSSATAVVATGPIPLCSLDFFKQSDLVQFSSWPGIGPFRGAAPDFTDPNQNKITVELTNNQVMKAQLSVADAPTDLLKLQMSADFLLESVGAKPGKIASFNQQLERLRPQLASSTSSAPLNLSAGAYLVNIYPKNQTAESLNYVINVNASNDSSKQAISVAVVPPTVMPKPTVTEVTPAVTAPEVTPPATSTTPIVTPPVTTTTTAPETTPATTDNATSDVTTTEVPAKKPKKTKRKKSKSHDESNAETSSAPGDLTAADTKPAGTETTTADTKPQGSDTASTGTNLAVVPKPIAPPVTPSEVATDPRKDEFKALINNWQTVKKAAVRTRDITQLNTVLSGNALQKQTNAVKWLTDNHKYYEMTPKNVSVDHYIEVVKDQKYSVYAFVSESSKYVDDSSGQPQVLKDLNNNYDVIYSIEKIGDQWFITDSAINQPTKR